MKWLKRIAIVLAVLILFGIFVRHDGIQYAMATVLGSYGKPYFNADVYSAVENCGSAPACGSGPLKVMSFNVFCRICDKGRTGYQPWDQRLPHLQERIAKYDPDLLGLQELGGHADIEDFLKAFPGYDYVAYAFGPWIYADCALFYKKERFEKLDSGQLWLSPKPELPFAKAWKLSMPRYVNWAYLRQKKDGFQFLYINTHFDNAGVNKEPAARFFAQTFGPIAAKMPVIVTGDFNTDSTTTRYRNLLGEGPGKLEDAYDLAKSKEIVSNFPEGAKIPDLDEFIDPVKAIDHVLVGGPLTKTVARWTLDSTLYDDHQRPSDHPSVFAEIELKLR